MILTIIIYIYLVSSNIYTTVLIIYDVFSPLSPHTHTGGISVLSVISTVALCVFSFYCIWLSSTQSLTQNMVIYRKNTILASRQKLSSAFTARINFVLDSPKAQICYYDCTNIPPITRPATIDVMRNCTPNRDPAFKQRRLVEFFENVDVALASIFMLSGSIVTFSVTGLDRAIELYILNRRADLDRFNRFFTGSDNSSFRSFYLNESNRYSVNFTVPEFEAESYYCGAFVLPPDRVNATFQYAIEGFRNVYNLSNSTDLSVQCVSLLDVDTTCPAQQANSFCYDLHIPLSYILRSMCVFLSATDPNRFISAQIQTFSTLENPLFGAPMGFGIIFFIAVVILMFVILIIYAYNKYMSTSSASSEGSSSVL